MAHQRMTGPELTPAIVQDADDGRVLMLAWMDEEALRRTRESGEAWFWSRSRRELWHKGETSGATLAVVELRDDCDGDAILLRVRAAGPVCHTGSLSCFAPWLWRRVAERARNGPKAPTSPACSSRARAPPPGRSARRASRPRSPAYPRATSALIEELADLWFHSYVLLAARGLDPAAVEDELARRVE